LIKVPPTIVDGWHCVVAPRRWKRHRWRQRIYSPLDALRNVHRQNQHQTEDEIALFAELASRTEQQREVLRGPLCPRPFATTNRRGPTREAARWGPPSRKALQWLRTALGDEPWTNQTERFTMTICGDGWMLDAFASSGLHEYGDRSHVVLWCGRRGLHPSRTAFGNQLDATPVALEPFLTD
jgi:hypothetical protein